MRESMKVVLSVCLAFFIGIMAAEPAEAKRFGSGGFGKTFKTSPFKKASPIFGQKSSGQKSAPANAQGLNGAKGKRPGMMGGLMGGLLAGGALAYLMGSGAFDGLQFMDILIFGLIGFVLFKLVFARKTAPQYAQQGGPSQQMDTSAPQAFEAQNIMQGQDEIPMDLPQGFDVTGFAQRAKEHFVLVNKAWDTGDMSTISEYLGSDLLAQLKAERAELDGPMSHDILDVDAEIVRSENTTEGHLVSLLFRGRIKDLNSQEESGIFDVWHMRRSEDGAWLIIGIEAQ